jgi:hypothetical protein
MLYAASSSTFQSIPYVEERFLDNLNRYIWWREHLRHRHVFQTTRISKWANLQGKFSLQETQETVLEPHEMLSCALLLFPIILTVLGRSNFRINHSQSRNDVSADHVEPNAGGNTGANAVLMGVDSDDESGTGHGPFTGMTDCNAAKQRTLRRVKDELDNTIWGDDQEFFDKWFGNINGTDSVFLMREMNV